MLCGITIRQRHKMYVQQGMLTFKFLHKEREALGLSPTKVFMKMLRCVITGMKVRQILAIDRFWLVKDALALAHIMDLLGCEKTLERLRKSLFFEYIHVHP